MRLKHACVILDHHLPPFIPSARAIVRAFFLYGGAEDAGGLSPIPYHCSARATRETRMPLYNAPEFTGSWGREMKNLLLAAGLVAATFSNSAFAADLGRPPARPVYTPAVPFAYNWTGCYVGGYVGGAWGDRDGATFTDLGNANFTSFSGGVGAARISPSHSWSADLRDSFIGGGTLGCNWQPFRSPFVLGVEGEFGHLRLTSEAFDPTTIRGGQTTPDVLGSARIGDWYGMVTGRLGYAWNRILLYVKGGAAFVPIQGSVVDTCLTTAGGCGNWVVSTASDRSVVTTWTIGGGVEWAFATNWSVKAEYMFIGLDDTRTSCGVATVASGAAVPGGPFCFDQHFDGINTAKVGLNYKFW